MLSQDHDADPLDAASDQRVDASGLRVPEPRAPSAARLLEMTALETDRWRSEASAEAAEIIASARQEAETLLRTARREAAEERATAEAEVARLQQVATRHEERLRRHFTDMLAELDR